MKQKLIFLQLVWMLCLFSTCLSTNAQIKKNTEIELSKLLDKISNTHKIFFTYDTKLIKNRLVQESGFFNLSIKESISLLQKLTPFLYDDLGNSYYVVYSKDEALNRRNKSKAAVSNYTTIDIDSSYSYKTIIVSGIVLSSDNIPLSGATLKVSKSLFGTTTNTDGTFQFNIQRDNNVVVGFLGHETKTLQLTPKKFHTIVLTSGQELDEVKIVGSRNKNRAANDTPVAIDFIDIENSAAKSSQVEINQFLQYAIPSFNASKQSGADGADHIDPATLRGLGPDQTLVLINGKRRHQASLINLYGTRGRGNSGTDLNAIPISAIKRIELLRDGASAQYGSDAIAGVLNIILKDGDDDLNVSSTVGFHNANSTGTLPSKIDGFTYKLALNYGAKIAENGFINFSTEALSSDNTIRPGTINRQKFGQASVKNVSFFLNAEIPIGAATKFYVNGGFNYKDTEAFAFTRAMDSERNVLDIYPEGFNPLITSNITDNSFSFGFVANFKDWNVDINNTFGRNNFHYFIKNTLNATLEENSPTEFDAGGHQLIQNTTSVDFSKYFYTKSLGYNIALGLEYRLDKYAIFAGEEASYASYDIYDELVTSQTPIANYKTFNGIIRPGGAQGFPGYAPENEVDRNRSNFSIYADTEIDFTKEFMIGAALRYEYYSDFGSTLNIKLASRYQVTPKLNIRGSYSTGFRAPSLAQTYYNLTFTNFIGNVPSESLLIANNNPIARSFNIDQLKEEKARNFSVGFTTKISPNFSASVDAYFVAIKDRIILSGNFDASSLGFGLDNVQFFANGVDTETKGLDMILNWKKVLDKSKISIHLSGNVNYMKLTEIKNNELDADTFFDARDQQFLLGSAPKSKFNLSFNYEFKKLETSINFTRFSRIKLIDWQIREDVANFNNSASERLNAATDIYKPKVTTDLHFNYQLNTATNLQLGVNNIFNIYPSRQNGYTDSGGLWDATQMGTNGAFYYIKLTFNL